MTGAAFDALLTGARSTLYGPETQHDTAILAHPLAHRPKIPPARRFPALTGNRPFAGLFANGARGTRTPDLLGAIQALSQLSYSPVLPP